MNNNKRVYLIIGVITITMLIMGVTTAWFTWNSTDNTDVSFNVEGLDITYTGNANVLNKKLYPTASMTNTDNVIHKFSLVTTSNIDIYTKISLDIIKLDDNLKDVSFRWNLYKEDTSIASGNFSNATIGSDVLLTQTEMITTTPTNYTLYIWIDGENYNNPLAMGGKEFYFKLKLEAGQQDYTTPEECFAFDESTGAITDYLCYEGNGYGKPTITDVVIPSEINGASVVAIFERNNSEIDTKSLGNTNNKKYVAKLMGKVPEKDGAFSYRALTSVAIPDSVISIGPRAFQGNNLTSITIPKSVTTIGGRAFENNNLTSVTIGNGVTSIGDSAFKNNNLTSVTIPNSVIQIFGSAFYGNALTNVTIPDSVTTIEWSAFENNNLTSVTIGDGITAIANSAFKNYNLTNVTIGNGVTTIGSSAFENNSLTSVTIGNRVTTIGNSAFENNNLTSVIIPDSVTSIEYDAFRYNNLTSVTIPDSVTEIPFNAFSNNNLTSIIIPNSVTIIGDSAFSYNNLTSVTIPDSVATINPGAFENNNLTSVKLGNGLTTIDGNVFENNNLTTITIPDSITTIKSYAFSDNNLTSITIPDGVTEIAAGAFRNNNLKTVYIGKNSKLNSLSTWAFYSHSSSNSNLTTIYNLGGKSLEWNLAIAGISGTAFVSGTVTTSDGRTVTITTSE